MKLDRNRIISLFALFADMPGIEHFKWSSLCNSAEVKLISKLRRNINVPKNMERLCSAAAALAYCDYTMLTAKNSAEDLSVGDISIKARSCISDAISTRDYMLADISDLLESPISFAFRNTGDDIER